MTNEPTENERRLRAEWERAEEELEDFVTAHRLSGTLAGDQITPAEEGEQEKYDELRERAKAAEERYNAGH